MRSIFITSDLVRYKQVIFDNNSVEVIKLFRNTRKNQLRNRVIAAAAGVAIMTFGIWINYKDAADDNTEDAVQKVTIEELSDEGTDKSDNEKESSETSTNNEAKSYLIKEADGVVKVFLCDETGKKDLYLITSVPFDLLSESDQQLFKKGVKLDTEEDLGKFLENFDS